MLKIKSGISYLLVLVSLLNFGCEDSSVEPDPSSSVIRGSVLYLEGSIAAFTPIQLRKLSSSLIKYTNADENGVYAFDSLDAGNYVVRFRSSSAEVYTFEVELTLSKNQTYEQDIFILYKKIDEFNALQKSKDVFLIKYQPEGGKIGNNHQFVDYLSGRYTGDLANFYTLGCDIYIAPVTLDWSSSDSLLTPEYIRQNYEFVTSIEETLFNGVHEIRFYEDDIVKILTNPSNGFIFVNKVGEERELKIPCIDFINNDFGLLIFYKQ